MPESKKILTTQQLTDMRSKHMVDAKARHLDMDSFVNSITKQKNMHQHTMIIFDNQDYGNAYILERYIEFKELFNETNELIIFEKMSKLFKVFLGKDTDGKNIKIAFDFVSDSKLNKELTFEKYCENFVETNNGGDKTILDLIKNIYIEIFNNIKSTIEQTEVSYCYNPAIYKSVFASTDLVEKSSIDKGIVIPVILYRTKNSEEMYIANEKLTSEIDAETFSAIFQLLHDKNKI